MAKRSHADEIEKVARSLLMYVRGNGRNGNWVRASVAFKVATEEHGTLEWVRYIEEKPRAKIVVTRVIERLMQSEFCDIEREKRGCWRSAPVFFRVRIQTASAI
jgi:hypothetical protein